MSHVYAVGIDPGARAGASFVGLHGNTPELVAAIPIYGKWPGPWYRRALDGFDQLSRELDLVVRRGGRYVGAWIEDPPVVSRRGALRGDSRGQKTWAGLGRREGALMAAAFHRGLGFPEQVENKAWRDLVRCPPKPKREVTAIPSRVLLAMDRIPSARETLIGLLHDRPNEVVDVAESMLIALALLRKYRKEHAI